MISAFGVDHGEIEKAFGLAGLGAAIGGATSRLGGKIAAGGARTIKRNPNMGRVGQAGVGAGGQLRKLGQGMMKRPGLTGGLAAGGAVGAGGAAGAFGNRRRY